MKKMLLAVPAFYTAACSKQHYGLSPKIKFRKNKLKIKFRKNYFFGKIFRKNYFSENRV